MKIQPEALIYAVGLFVTTLVRWRYSRGHRRAEIKRRGVESRIIPLCMACWGLAQLAAIVYFSSSWLDFANYPQPRGTAAVGSLAFALGVILLWRSHVDLGQVFSPFLEIQRTHHLVTHGVYHWIRHPMYTAHGLWSIGQALMVPNWLAGPPALLAFATLYLLRVPREEQIMLDEFGDAYRSYQQRTGRLLPRWRPMG